MINSKALFHDFVSRLTLKDDPEELRSMAYLVFENLFGFSKTDILSSRELLLTNEQSSSLESVIQRLNKNEPVQYILDEADFYGRTFKLNSSVLIPRPETEELVRLVVSAHKAKRNLSILDIGTGSGCIAITLALELHESNVIAYDVRDEALTVARKNAQDLKANVSFKKHDILLEELPSNAFDCIVSNPPYITKRESENMQNNVLLYEPSVALFVENNDPLLFYNAIAAKAANALKVNGSLYFEINASFGKEVAALLSTSGFTDVSVIKDLSGKDRIVKGILPSRK